MQYKNFEPFFCMLVLPISPMFPEFLARLHTTLLVLFCSSIHFIPFYIFSNWFTSRLWVLYDIVSSFMIRSSFTGNNCESEMCALFVCNCIYSLFQVPRALTCFQINTNCCKQTFLELSIALHMSRREIITKLQ